MVSGIAVKLETMTPANIVPEGDMPPQLAGLAGLGFENGRETLYDSPSSNVVGEVNKAFSRSPRLG